MLKYFVFVSRIEEYILLLDYYFEVDIQLLLSLISFGKFAFNWFFF